jgi:hypothetical protein
MDKNSTPIPIKIPTRHNRNRSESSFYSDTLNHATSYSNITNHHSSSYSPPTKLSRSLDTTLKHRQHLDCKGGGVIPYTIYQGRLLFLLQKTIDPVTTKNMGWCDFGGKKNEEDLNSIYIACREFMEETSCLFYLKLKGRENDEIYQKLKDNPDFYYTKQTINELKKLIDEAKVHYRIALNDYDRLRLQVKDVYVSYLVKVDYIDALDFPRCEDVFMNYEDKYIRQCRWFTYDELQGLETKDFHKRIQIMHIKERIEQFYKNNVFDLEEKNSHENT